MRSITWMEAFAGALLLASLILASGTVTLVHAQAPANPLADLPGALRATAGCLGVELASTASGKQVIFAWFENKKAALAWYYSDTHRTLMKMGGGHPRPGGPMADVPDDGRPIMAIASVTLARPEEGIPQNGLPAVSQIAIELYAPLPGGLAVGGRFAPASVDVPGLLVSPSATPPGTK